MKVITDCMLGKLTRWLRIFGIDTVYALKLPLYSHEKVLEISEKENRILITRNEVLHKKALSVGLQSIFVKEETLSQQLIELKEKLNLAIKLDPNFSRCPKCNAELILAEKEGIKEKVKPNIYNKYPEFWLCKDCDQIYWQGHHWTTIQNSLKEVGLL